MTDPNAPRVFRLRSIFVEQGRLAMLSHLEVAHALERMVRRAGLPFAVSQGFSPHMKIAFGAALPVGVGSTCEIFDLQLTHYVAPDKALAALQAASVPDLMVQECVYIDNKAPAASVAFPFSTYEVVFDGFVDQDAIQVPETITVVRKRKEKELVVAEFLAVPFEVHGDCADACADAGARVGMHVDSRASMHVGARVGAHADPRVGTNLDPREGVRVGAHLDPREGSHAGARATFTLEAKPTGSLRPDVLLSHCSIPTRVTSITRIAQTGELAR